MRYTISTTGAKPTRHRKLPAVVRRVNQLVNQGHRGVTVEDSVSGHKTMVIGETVAYSTLYTALHTDDWRTQ